MGCMFSKQTDAKKIVPSESTSPLLSVDVHSSLSSKHRDLSEVEYRRSLQLLTRAISEHLDAIRTPRTTIFSPPISFKHSSSGEPIKGI